MTDLDRKIAELKGWKRPEWEKDFPFEPGDGLYSAGGTLEYIEGQEAPMWSQDIAKAFELVDEICIDQDNKKGARFHLIQWEAKTGIAAHWEARIEPYWIDGEYTLTQVGNRFDGRGQTRPEAICRAYIALREREVM